MNDIDKWSNMDLFNFLTLHHIIYPMDDFETWNDEESRKLMIQMLEDNFGK